MKEKMKRNEKLVGLFLSEIAAPNLVRLLKAAGADFIVVDCEHGYFDYSQVAALAAVANGISMPLIVRMAGISREAIQKYLDAGVDGIWSPMVETAEQARRMVQLGKYAPEGVRGISTMRPHSNYAPGNLTDYTKAANERTMFFAQIETKLGAENADAIAAVEGIDGIFVGPNDLACDLGHAGNFDTADMDAAIGQILAAAKRHSIPCGMVASSTDFLHRWELRGMTLFSCNSELGLLKAGVQQMLKMVRGQGSNGI